MEGQNIRLWIPYSTSSQEIICVLFGETVEESRKVLEEADEWDWKWGASVFSILRSWCWASFKTELPTYPHNHCVIVQFYSPCRSASHGILCWLDDLCSSTRSCLRAHGSINISEILWDFGVNRCLVKLAAAAISYDMLPLLFCASSHASLYYPLVRRKTQESQLL